MCTLFVLGGWLIKEGDIWRLPQVGEPAEKGLPDNSALRVEAAACFYSTHRKTTIIVSGGSGRLTERGAPSVASVMKRALIERGVHEADIECEEHSKNTWQQLAFLARTLKRKRLGQVIIISNEWHLPRVNAFISDAPDPFRKALAGVSVRSAEDILLECGGKWRKVVEEARRSPGLEEREKLEAQGVAAIEAGTYRPGQSSIV